MKHHDDDHQDYGGLHEDLRLTGASMKRRTLIRLALGTSALAILGCSSSATSNNGEGDGDGDPDSCTQIPEETAGPYPGDGSNGPDVLSQTGVVRSDITSSFAGLSGTAAGVALTVKLTIVSASSCAPLEGYAVYLWHCDREGRYSLYSSGVTSQNYLRGVQAADANGEVTFTTIFPGCYSGRWPHIHFEVYPSLTAATDVDNEHTTSQIALPAAICNQVYAQSGYEASVTNLNGVSLTSDMIFRDSAALELATMSGSIGSGLTATLTVAV